MRRREAGEKNSSKVRFSVPRKTPLRSRTNLEIVWEGVKRVHFRYNLQKLYGFRKGPISIVLSKLVDPTEPGIAVAEAETVGVARVSLNIGYTYNVFGLWPEVCKRDLEKYRDHNVFVIGGPDRNLLCRELIGSRTEGTRFSKEGKTLYFQGESYTCKLRNDNTPERDYGIIIKMRNPFHDNRWIIICAGCRAFGTLAATMAFTDPVIERMLFKMFGEESPFEVLVHGIWKKENPYPISYTADWFCPRKLLRILNVQQSFSWIGLVFTLGFAFSLTKSIAIATLCAISALGAWGIAYSLGGVSKSEYGSSNEC